MPAEFEDLGTQLARFQGGAIILHGYGCSACGHGFWIEDDDRRATDPASLACPRCGAAPSGVAVPSARAALVAAGIMVGTLLDAHPEHREWIEGCIARQGSAFPSADVIQRASEAIMREVDQPRSVVGEEPIR